MSFTVEKISHAWRSLTDNQSIDNNNRDRELCQHGIRKVLVAEKIYLHFLIFCGGLFTRILSKNLFSFPRLNCSFYTTLAALKDYYSKQSKMLVVVISGTNRIHLSSQNRVRPSANISINCCGWLNDGFINSLDEIERKLGFCVKGTNKYYEMSSFGMNRCFDTDDSLWSFFFLLCWLLFPLNETSVACTKVGKKSN